MAQQDSNLMLVRIKTIERPHPSQMGAEDRELTQATLVVRDIGSALNFVAPDPALGAVFEIEVIGRDLTIVTD